MVDKQVSVSASRLLILVAAWSAFALSTSAGAHAVVVQATPAVNAAVARGDLAIRLQFNSRIDAQRSRLTLQDPDNKPVAVTSVSSEPNVLAGRARVESPGQWSLRWQVLSRDGHITRGDVRFTVR